MSMHKIPLTNIEREGLEKHGLGRNIGKPSQLADVFRQGVKWGQEQEREACARVCDDAAHRLDCKADELRKDAMETGDYTIVNGVEVASDALASAAEAIRAQGLA